MFLKEWRSDISGIEIPRSVFLCDSDLLAILIALARITDDILLFYSFQNDVLYVGFNPPSFGLNRWARYGEIFMFFIYVFVEHERRPHVLIWGFCDEINADLLWNYTIQRNLEVKQVLDDVENDFNKFVEEYTDEEIIREMKKEFWSFYYSIKRELVKTKENLRTLGIE